MVIVTRSQIVLLAIGAVALVVMLWWTLGAVGATSSPTGDPTTTRAIGFWHDEARHVGCWVYHLGPQGGISCLPDGQYTQ